jgi:hypothetical protein
MDMVGCKYIPFCCTGVAHQATVKTLKILTNSNNSYIDHIHIIIEYKSFTMHLMYIELHFM